MKKQLKGKVLASVLCAAMTLSLAACGSAEGGDASTQAAAAGKETAQESTQKETKEETKETAEETKGEPVTITVEVFDRGNMTEEYGTPTDNKWTKIMQEKILEATNVNVEYVAIPRSEEVTKLQAMMAADSEPDIFYTYDVEQMIKWADGEVLADLTPYMDTEAGKSLESVLGRDVLDFGVVGGKQYAVNAVRYDQGQYSCYIRKDLLDQVGVELTETDGHYAMKPSELKDALLKIKEQGLCDYPFGMYNVHDSRMPIEGAFLKESTAEELARGQSGCYFPIDAEGTKEAYRFMNECYNEGLINPDFALFDGNSIAEAIASGQTAFWSECYWMFTDSMNALLQAEPEAEIVAVELVHEDGAPAYYEKYAPIGAFGMVSASCEDVEAALKVINWMMTSEEAHLLTHHGIEGENYSVQDGNYVAIDPEYNKTDRISVGDLNVLLNYDPCQAKEGYFEAKTREGHKNAEIAESITEAYLDAQRIAVSDGKFVFPAINENISASMDYAAELGENLDNLWIGSIIAPADQFDETYDNYYNTFMEEGGEQRAQQRQDAYANSQK